MIIVVDAMGGDNAPGEIVKGCLAAAKREHRLKIVLVGRSEDIAVQLTENPDNIEVMDAREVIENDEAPVAAIRRKKDSSMSLGMNLVREKKADAFISAGNTGALMAGALLIIGRIKGIDRPALAPIIPTINGGAMLIDAGANADCKPVNLLQFGYMGSAYMERVLDIKKPRVAIINIGAEKTKGNQLSKEAYTLLESADLNFIGNIEARDIPFGRADVLVCDGFVGNITLKLIEGLSSAIFTQLKKEFTSSYVSKLAAAVLKPGLKRMKDSMDYKEYGGAPLLGIAGGCFKAHGSSDARAIENAIMQAVKFIDMNVEQKIVQGIGMEAKS